MAVAGNDLDAPGRVVRTHAREDGEQAGMDAALPAGLLVPEQAREPPGRLTAGIAAVVDRRDRGRLAGIDVAVGDPGEGHGPGPDAPHRARRRRGAGRRAVDASGG